VESVKATLTLNSFGNIRLQLPAEKAKRLGLLLGLLGLDLIRSEIFLIEFLAFDSMAPRTLVKFLSLASRRLFTRSGYTSIALEEAASGSYSHTQYYGVESHSELGRVLSETVRCATAP
jgi:hypothetical protein